MRSKLSLNNKVVSLVGSIGLSGFTSVLTSTSQSLFQWLLSFAGRFVKQNNVANNSAKAKVDRLNLKSFVHSHCCIAHSNGNMCNGSTRVEINGITLFVYSDFE